MSSAETKPLQDSDEVEEPPRYVPPCTLVLQGLGIDASQLAKDQVTVSTRFLKRLIASLTAGCRFDPEWYGEKYPDVQGAYLAGDIASLHQHFLEAGYFENRLPAELPFDPDWYYHHYSDLASAFTPDDVAGLRDHFESFGYFEGRAGTPAMQKEADEWVQAAS